MKGYGHLKELGQVIFENAVAKGFYDDGIRDDKIPERLMLIVSELSEALEEWRNGHQPGEVYFKPENPNKPEGVAIEMADALIRLLDFCRAYGIDIDEAVRIKMIYNATRPYRHGGKKA